MDSPSHTTASRSAPDPRDAPTPKRFVELLRELRTSSGMTYRQLERRAVHQGDVLPYSTVFHALRRDTLPREELLVAFVRACGCNPAETAFWVEARSRLAAEIATGPPVVRDRPAPLDEPEPPAPERPAMPPAPGKPRAGPNGRGRRLILLAAGLVAVLLVWASADAQTGTSRTLAKAAPSSTRCPVVLAIGGYGVCIQQLQEKLQRKGLELPADGSFGPYTRMRVTAFQIFAGLPHTGMADARTQASLGAGGSPLLVWTRAQVKDRLSQVFPEAPDRAIAMAFCLSFGDPLWIYGPDKKGTRRWGLFQFTDLELFSLRATEVQALDPEWNIQAARQIWKRTRDFRHWSCPPPNSPERGGLPRPSISP